MPVRHSMVQLPSSSPLVLHSKVLELELGRSKVLERVQVRNKVLAQRHHTSRLYERHT